MLGRLRFRTSKHWIGLFWRRTEYDDGLTLYFVLIPCLVSEFHFEPADGET